MYDVSSWNLIRPSALRLPSEFLDARLIRRLLSVPDTLDSGDGKSILAVLSKGGVVRVILLSSEGLLSRRILFLLADLLLRCSTLLSCALDLADHTDPSFDLFQRTEKASTPLFLNVEQRSLYIPYITQRNMRTSGMFLIMSDIHALPGAI